MYLTINSRSRSVSRNLLLLIRTYMLDLAVVLFLLPSLYHLGYTKEYTQETSKQQAVSTSEGHFSSTENISRQHRCLNIGEYQNAGIK
jgi:hypothetical protein